MPAPQPQAESVWEEAAPGLSYKLLATDTEKGRVSLLVRLAPGSPDPPHRHGGVEELYLLHGELMIEDRKLYPGDYNRAEPGTADQQSGARPAAPAFSSPRPGTSSTSF